MLSVDMLDWPEELSEGMHRASEAAVGEQRECRNTL